MEILKESHQLVNLSRKHLKSDISVGLVPTMGALHEGHISLIRQSQKDNDVTIATIFVNPLQFNNPQDLAKYPKTWDHDMALLELVGCDYVFAPSEDEMYSPKPVVSIDFGSMDKILEGEHRPGHFAGVGVVVSKLLNLSRPNRAYFGMKDLQQFLLIKKMVQDLNMQVEILGLPTIREKSGLALSSRNMRLTDEGRAVAPKIAEGLHLVKENILDGYTVKAACKSGTDFYHGVDKLEVEYLEAINPDTFNQAKGNETDMAICFAGYVEGIRLIDNLYLRNINAKNADRSFKV